jgi:hypothetical protein
MGGALLDIILNIILNIILDIQMRQALYRSRETFCPDVSEEKRPLFEGFTP